VSLAINFVIFWIGLSGFGLFHFTAESAREQLEYIVGRSHILVHTGDRSSPMVTHPSANRRRRAWTSISVPPSYSLGRRRKSDKCTFWLGAIRWQEIIMWICLNDLPFVINVLRLCDDAYNKPNLRRRACMRVPARPVRTLCVGSFQFWARQDVATVATCSPIELWVSRIWYDSFYVRASARYVDGRSQIKVHTAEGS